MHVLQPDAPTLDDLRVRQIGEHIADCEPPHVFGILGEWGTGKTSFRGGRVAGL